MGPLPFFNKEGIFSLLGKVLTRQGWHQHQPQAVCEQFRASTPHTAIAPRWMGGPGDPSGASQVSARENRLAPGVPPSLVWVSSKWPAIQRPNGPFYQATSEQCGDHSRKSLWRPSFAFVRANWSVKNLDNDNAAGNGKKRERLPIPRAGRLRGGDAEPECPGFPLFGVFLKSLRLTCDLSHQSMISPPAKTYAKNFVLSKKRDRRPPLPRVIEFSLSTRLWAAARHFRKTFGDLRPVLKIRTQDTLVGCSSHLCKMETVDVLETLLI